MQLNLFVLTCLFIALLAPVFFLVTGAVLLPKGKESANDEWKAGRNLLLGIVTYGLLGEFSLISGICWEGCFVLLLLVVAVLAVFRLAHLAGLLSHCSWFFCYYLVALSAWVTILFPLPGNWGGDWYENIRLGQGAFDGVMPHDLIGRTPLFGSASLPLALLTNGLGGISVLTCVVAATLAFLIRGFLLRYFGCKRKALWVPLVFCCSGIYLQNAAFPWNKFLAAACLFAAAGEILCQSKTKMATVSSSFWIAAAVATHEASILFVPAILCLWIFTSHFSSVRSWVWRVCALVICLGCLVAPYELWTIAKFGWQEKVARNPSVYYRSENHHDGTTVSGICQTAGEVLFTTFVPNPTVIPSYWTSQGFEKSPRGFVMRMYFSISAYRTYTAGTLFFAVLPLLGFPLVWKRGMGFFRDGLVKRTLALLICLTLAVVGNAVLNAYSSPFGSLQTGLTPLGVFAFCAITFLILQPDGKERPLLAAAAALQTLPWFLLQAGVLAACILEHKIGNDFLWVKFWKTSGDFRVTFEQFGGSLGYRLFPFQFIFYLATITVIYFAARRSTTVKRPLSLETIELL